MKNFKLLMLSLFAIPLFSMKQVKIINNTKLPITVSSGTQEFTHGHSEYVGDISNSHSKKLSGPKDIAVKAQDFFEFDKADKNAWVQIMQGSIYTSIGYMEKPWGGSPWGFENNGSKLKAHCDFTADNPHCSIYE